ncbi:MAG TPA: cytochrome c3 family protein [Rhodanobacteraceae bacterium]|nr:cytochrome c3 family protein [Rhodanobacteraceae bacterium]
MSQLFPSTFGFYVRLALIAVVVIVTAGFLAWRGLTDAPNVLNEPIEQPVPFSHKHHVGDDGIACRYCHTSVETSKFAGIPPIQTCMTCHSQLYTNQPVLAPLVASWTSGKPLHWNRVNRVPDFVFFNHSIHIAKGVGCVSCHGRIDKMPLTRRAAPLSMEWCLSCHRNPEKHLRPRAVVFDMQWKAKNQQALGKRLVREYHIDKAKLTECSTCHR